MPLPFHRRRLDPDAADFCRRSGATDRAAINAFVRGVKDLGLWDNMVCWPLRSSQNSGGADPTNTTVYSLGGLGTYDGTRVNGPAWGVDGIDFVAASNTHITTTYSIGPSPKVTLWAVGSSAALTGGIISAWAASQSTKQFLISRKLDTGRYVYFTRSAGATRTTNGINTSISGFASIGLGTQGANTLGTVNGVLDATIAFLPDESGTQPVNIGIQSAASGFPYEGKIAFALAFSSTDGLTTAQQLSLHTLYKSTLGTGLGLP